MSSSVPLKNRPPLSPTSMRRNRSPDWALPSNVPPTSRANRSEPLLLMPFPRLVIRSYVTLSGEENSWANGAPVRPEPVKPEEGTVA